MKERMITTCHDVAGTTTGNVTRIDEFPFSVTFLKLKAWASNDSDATLALSGGATVTATTIGDSGDPKTISPTAPVEVAADTAITFTLDYDGAGGTAGQNVQIIAFYLVGED